MEEELDALIAEGLASQQMTEEEFWASVNKETDAMLAEYKSNLRNKKPGT